MVLNSFDTGITLIGPPGSGKSTLAKILVERLAGYTRHDHDDNGLEPALQLMGYQSISDAIIQMGDRAFLEFEGKYTQENYGRTQEKKTFSLDATLFASSGSIVRSREAIEYIRARTHIIFLDIPHHIAIEQIRNRPGGSGRIIGMNGGPNGEMPMSNSLEAELIYREDLYKQYQDSTLGYSPGESAEQTAARLFDHIMQILKRQ